MGGSSYSYSDRATRSVASGFYSKSRDDIFTQNKERKIHPEMDPNGVTIREARDSEAHPNSIPIIIALDLTGSMGHIPHDLVKDGLPKIMSGIIQHGIPDPQVLFLGIGDHECDDAPLQVSQFESGDVELDMWLTRTYIESGGGGNLGESYGLAHYFAGHHTVTDNWEKRGQKGFLFTIGDEPNLQNYPSSALKELMGKDAQVKTYTADELLEKAQEKWNVYHIMPNKDTRNARTQWEQKLGQNLIWIDDATKVADTIRDIVISNTSMSDTIKVSIDVPSTIDSVVINTTSGVKSNIML